MTYEKKISVIMGVYNQWNLEQFNLAVDSVLKQTFRDFEFIIYNDGSDPKVSDYINSLSDRDERIVVIGQEKNHGLAFSLNECIDIAKGKYIARMDADDISLPDRFQIQYDFLERNTQYYWCGCNAQLIDDRGVWGERIMPQYPDKHDYLMFSPYIHPSVMYRAELFKHTTGYSEARETLRCEDYEMFMRLYQLGYKGYNIQSVLFQYREDANSFKRRKFKYRVNEMKIRYRNFSSMHMMFPIGWVYCIRPVAASLIPTKLLSFIKRKRYENIERPEAEIIQANTGGTADVLRGTQSVRRVI